jgi:hypothetical protein
VTPTTMDEIAEAEIREAEESKKKKQAGSRRTESDATFEDDFDNDYDECVS